MRALVTRVRSNSSWNRWKKLLLVRPLSRKRRGRKKKESYKALYVNMQTPKKNKKTKQKRNKNKTTDSYRNFSITEKRRKTVVLQIFNSFFEGFYVT